MKKYIFALAMIALIVPGYSLASGTAVSSPVRLLVNGSDTPEPVEFTGPFVVSWHAPHNMRCHTYGMFVPTWDDQAVNWANMDDYASLPPTGSVKLMAALLLNQTTPTYYPALLLGMECMDGQHKIFKDEIIVPVLFTVG